MNKLTILTYLFSISFNLCTGYYSQNFNQNSGFSEVFSWKQVSYDFDGVVYSQSADQPYGTEPSSDPLTDDKKFFIQKNNVPIGFEVYKNKLFVTVPRRQYGIPSTLNYLDLNSPSPLLKPYPDVGSINSYVSIYRPRVDVCNRLWMVDTGLLEVPGARKQVQPPAIIIYDLKTNQQIFRQELDSSIIVTERTPGGLTSITVDVSRDSCEDAFAYINDLATEGLVVFSLKDKTSWRVDHPSFKHEDAAMNFSSSGHVLQNWKDGLFSLALVNDGCEQSKLYYHALVATQEYALSTSVLKSRASLDGLNLLLGNRGPNTQSGSHDYHSRSNVLFFANVAQAGVLCWNINKPVTPQNYVLVASDADKMGYIGDLKVKGNEVWLLSNQIPKFIYGSQNTNDFNYFIMKGKVNNLIRGTNCDSF